MKQRVFLKRGSISIGDAVVKFDEIVIPVRQISFMNITQQPTGLFWMIFVSCAISIIGTAMSGYDNGQFYTTQNMQIAFALAVAIGAVSLFFAMKPKQYLSVKSSSGHGHTIWSREYADLSSIKNGIEAALTEVYGTDQ